MGALIRSGAEVPAPAAVEAAAQGRQYLTFCVCGDVFAIPISGVREIIGYRQPTDVPMMAAYVRGVINLRGRVVPVIDLAVRFGRAAGEVTRRTCIVILELAQEGHKQDISVVVDAVSAVVDILDADVEPPPQFGARLRSDFISGMGKLAGKFVVILDPERVLSVEELSRHAAMDVEEAPPLAAR